MAGFIAGEGRVLTILDLYSQRKLEARRVSNNKGGEYHGPCPGCDGQDRFHLWPEQGEHGTYWCRQCGKAGDAIQFLRDFEGLSFKAACAAMGRELVQDIPSTPRHREKTWRPQPSIPLDDQWQEKAAKLVEWSHKHLLGCPDQLKWLASRGIGLETVKAFRLGWNPGEKGRDLWRAREPWGLPEVINERTRKPKPLWLPCGLVIPCIDQSGAVLRIRIRRPEGEPRYYVVPGSSAAPLYLARSRSVAVVVESELDALAVYEAAGDLVGAYAIGNSSAKPDAETFSRLRELPLILIATDFDEPDQRGQRAGAKAASWWIENLPQSERWPVPTGKDPGEAFMTGVDLRSWVRTGLPPALALVANLKEAPVEEIDLDSTDDKGVVIEGRTGGGRRYVIADVDEESLQDLLEKYSDRAVFMQSELEVLKGAGPEEGEIAAMVKDVFPGAVIVESIKL